MKYLCLVYLDEKRLDELPDEDCVAYDTEIRGSGYCLASEALQSADGHHGARMRNGKLSVTDGPFAETKEQLAGFLHDRGQGLNEAIQIAAKIPPARVGCVEVRPIRPIRETVAARVCNRAEGGVHGKQETESSESKGDRQQRAKPVRKLTLLVATRKGAWLYHGDAARRSWRVDGPHFLGHVISHLVLDPRDGRTLLAAAKTGHLGPTMFRSTDRGRNWKEAARPPAFAKGARRARKGARSITPSGSRRAIATNRTSGMRAPRRRDCSAPTTAA